jgi:beta-barrel assembly-enhancing protease
MRTLVPLLCLWLSGCAALFGSSGRSVERTAAQLLVSDQQEAQLGLQVHDELVKQQVKFTQNPAVQQYVDGLVIKTARAANADRRVDWKWFVIDDPKTVNAFATPGGRIYVYTGLLLAARNEAEVVGVLGHELGHVVARHTARQLVAAKGLETVAAMALGQRPNEIAALAASLAGKGAMLAYGRDMETEADEYGVKYAAINNYDPNGLATFFEAMQGKGDLPGFLVFLSTHPTHAQRVSDIRRQIAKTGARGSELGADRLAAIQAALKK